MIGRLRGTLVAKRLDEVVVDVGGVGYEVAVTPATLAELPAVGEEIVLHTHLHVREDAMVVYGFTTDSQQSWFRVLINTPGIGPKVGMAILATLSPEEIVAAVAGDDVDTLTLVPGIGKRSAQKLVLELKPKVGELAMGSTAGRSDAAQVRDALEQLGYSAGEIREATADLDPGTPVAEQIRTALQALGRDRHA